MKAMLLSALLLFGSSTFAAEPNINCKIGPVTKTFGGSSWLVFGCSDKRSVVVVTASGSIAAPFYFMFAFGTSGYKLYGEGTGNKAATDAAYKDLIELSASQIDGLFSEASRPNTVSLQEINITADSARGWLPSVDQRAQVPQVVQNFLSALDSGHEIKAYDFMTEGQKKSIPFAEFANRLSQFNAQAGPVKERRIVKITWTKDPVNAPAAGIYAAVDLVSRFTNIDRHCGYMVLYQSDSRAPFLVMRQEDNYFTNEQAKQTELKQSHEAVDKVWAKLAQNCPNYDGHETK
ncbi:hypothetical protein AAKU64_000659 [Undibacterium sp. GrIS 1.8]|uniref:DUF4019 domain-containing protein n=1 Tax=Undibacterium sp. GrIS 1.8 TaxID=3143934 RepID=UPI00339ACB80